MTKTPRGPSRADAIILRRLPPASHPARRVRMDPPIKMIVAPGTEDITIQNLGWRGWDPSERRGSCLDVRAHDSPSSTTRPRLRKEGFQGAHGWF
ncbi:hypothetical protein PCANC_11958 [Puccinia coronata f. sp. avenae]|uniref:Uncharacterized protein n=1 Tax=Puccinia coronata f. sp. avenae TaxID=200324 RepID=A0A2N5T3A0_9BASI|nr:hypothetical protein PCANC_11958 [Puccinia coronata f. sp. avenae]